MRSKESIFQSDRNDSIIELRKEDIAELVFSPIQRARRDYIIDHFLGIARLKESLIVLVLIYCRFLLISYFHFDFLEDYIGKHLNGKVRQEMELLLLILGGIIAGTLSMKLFKQRLVVLYIIWCAVAIMIDICVFILLASLGS